MSELFPGDFIQGLNGLRIVARRVPRGGRHAEHPAREAGSGVEFRDYRPYVPGDDLRRVDWSLYRRFERLFLRLADEVRDFPLYLLVDLSTSAWVAEPPRATAARRAAAVLAAVSLSQLDPVSVQPFGAELAPALPAVSGQRGLPRVLEFLEDCRPLGGTDFRTSFAHFGARRLREGLLVVISDFFDPAGIEAVTAALSPLRHRLLLVRLVRDADREPTLGGDVRLRDCESGTTVDVSVTERVLERYREAYRRFDGGLRDFVASRAAGLFDLDVDAPVIPQFERLFEAGVLRT